MVKDTIERMGENKLERCYGINAAAKNDCAEGAHSCAARRPRCNLAKAGIALRLSIAKLRHSSGGGLDGDSYREPEGSGTPLRYLDAIRRHARISLNGVGLSLRSAEGIDPAHLERIRRSPSGTDSLRPFMPFWGWRQRRPAEHPWVQVLANDIREVAGHP